MSYQQPSFYWMNFYFSSWDFSFTINSIFKTCSGITDEIDLEVRAKAPAFGWWWVPFLVAWGLYPRMVEWTSQPQLLIWAVFCRPARSVVLHGAGRGLQEIRGRVSLSQTWGCCWLCRDGARDTRWSALYGKLAQQRFVPCPIRFLNIKKVLFYYTWLPFIYLWTVYVDRLTFEFFA